MNTSKSKNFKISKDGFTMVEVIAAMGLLLLMSLGITEMAFFSNKMSVSSKQKYSSLETANALQQVLNNVSSCGCNFRTLLTTPDEVLIGTTPGSQATLSRISAFDSVCTEGSRIATNGQTLPTESALRSNIRVINQGQIGTGVILADIQTQIDTVNNSMVGSNTQVYSNRVALIYEVDGAQWKITDCSNLDSAVEANWLRMEYVNANEIQVSTVNNSTIVALLENGQTLTNGTSSETWNWGTAHAGILQGGPDLPNTWYYVYLYPNTATPGQFSIGVSSRAPHGVNNQNKGFSTYQYIGAFFNADAGGGVNNIVPFTQITKNKFKYQISRGVASLGTPTNLNNIVNLGQFIPRTALLADVEAQVARDGTWATSGSEDALLLGGQTNTANYTSRIGVTTPAQRNRLSTEVEVVEPVNQPDISYRFLPTGATNILGHSLEVKGWTDSRRLY